MDNEDIIRMAREAGFEGLLDKAWGIEQLERFAAIVAAHVINRVIPAAVGDTAEAVLSEREACAKVCDTWGINNYATQECAAEIRARGEK